jgi:hypothetical protein
MVWIVITRGKTHSLHVTLCLVSEEWPRVGSSLGSAIRDNYSSRVDSFSPGYTLFKCQKNGPGWGIVQDNRSLGQTHSLKVTLCLVSEEWPRVRNGPNIS